jgi:hypothetical protein
VCWEATLRHNRERGSGDSASKSINERDNMDRGRREREGMREIGNVSPCYLLARILTHSVM